MDKPAEAIKCYDEVIKLNDENDEAWTNKGNALRALDKVDDALKCFDKALEVNPDNIEAKSGKAMIEKSKKK
jgi:tetratricopeptide (TPR) repeat protein